MTVSEFNNNEKQLDLERIIENLRDQNEELRHKNCELMLKLAMYSNITEDAKEGKVNFTDGEVMRDDPHILEEYKAATARMNKYFEERCDQIDAQE